jgi:hypothetical protein
VSSGAPTLTSLYDATDDLLTGLNSEIAEERALQFKNDPDLCRKIVALYSASWADVPPSPHVERHGTQRNKYMERETRLELATSTLARMYHRCSKALTGNGIQLFLSVVFGAFTHGRQRFTAT